MTSGINGGHYAFNSNFTLNDSKLEIEKVGNKPPLIPSLKAKIFQTAIGLGPQTTSKSGGQTVAMTGVTGMTTDDKLLFLHDYSSAHNHNNYSRTGYLH